MYIHICMFDAMIPLPQAVVRISRLGDVWDIPVLDKFLCLSEIRINWGPHCIWQSRISVKVTERGAADAGSAPLQGEPLEGGVRPGPPPHPTGPPGRRVVRGPISFSLIRGTANQILSSSSQAKKRKLVFDLTSFPTSIKKKKLRFTTKTIFSP